MAYQYTEFDLNKANEYLDKAGLTKKDAEGYRLRQDGKRVTLTAEIATINANLGDGFNLIKNTWKQAGVDLNVKIEDRAIQWERKAANETELFVWAAGGGGGLDVMLNAQAYFPDRVSAWWAPAWGDWYATRGAKGEEPPADVKKMMEMYDKLQTQAKFEDQVKIMKDILQILRRLLPGHLPLHRPEPVCGGQEQYDERAEVHPGIGHAADPRPDQPGAVFLRQVRSFVHGWLSERCSDSHRGWNSLKRP